MIYTIFNLLVKAEQVEHPDNVGGLPDYIGEDVHWYDNIELFWDSGVGVVIVAIVLLIIVLLVITLCKVIKLEKANKRA